MRNTVFIGIGSNLGDKIDNCRSAIERIGDFRETRILLCSSFYKTDPVGYRNQDWFVNCVIKIETGLGLRELFEALQDLEKILGRKRTFLWGPRVIDLDILLFNDGVFKDEDLQVPHPRLQERAFVLVPLCEIEPEATHPALRKTVRELVESLNETQGVERI